MWPEPGAWTKHLAAGRQCLGKAWPTKQEKTPPVCKEEHACQASPPRKQWTTVGKLGQAQGSGCVCVCLLDGQVCVLAGQVGQLMKSSLGVLLSLWPVPQLPLSLVGLGPLSAQAAWARASCSVTLVTNLRIPRSTGDAILAEQ